MPHVLEDKQIILLGGMVWHVWQTRTDMKNTIHVKQFIWTKAFVRSDESFFQAIDFNLPVRANAVTQIKGFPFSK